MTRWLVPAISLALLWACTPSESPPPPAAQPPANAITRYSVDGSFDTVKEDITLAITNRGLVIDHTSHISDMLERTGKDLGMTKKVFAKAEALSFCSAVVSRKTMEADPHNIAFCPYVIAIYAVTQETNKVYVAFRRPRQMAAASAESAASLKAVEELLDGIVREALNLSRS